MTKITRQALETIGPLEAVRMQDQHFGIAYTGAPRHLDSEEKLFRFKAMVEEVIEYLSADNLEDEYDALLDLLVFTLGTMTRQGLPIDGLVDVIFANMQKELGANQKRGGFKLDLKKPEGWTPPNLSRYLNRDSD